MPHKENSDDRENTHLNSVKLKTKIVVAIALSIIVVVLAVNAYRNKPMDKKTNHSNTYITSNSKQETKDNTQGKSEDNQQQTEIQSEKQNLEKKYETALGEYYGSEDKKTDVINITTEIIKEDDKFYKAYSLRGLANCFINISDDNYKNGLADINKALELKPDYGYGLFCKGLALELYAHYDEALTWYDKALVSLKAENNTEFMAWSYFGKSSIYGRRGDVQNCTDLLKMAIDLNPSAKQVAIDEENSDFKNVKDSEKFKNLVK